MEKKGSKL